MPPMYLYLSIRFRHEMCQSARPSKSDPHPEAKPPEAETLSGIALSGREDVAKVAPGSINMA